MILCGDLPPARYKLCDSVEQRRQRNWTVNSALIIQSPALRDPCFGVSMQPLKALWKRRAEDLEGVGGHWSLLGLQPSPVKEKPV